MMTTADVAIVNGGALLSQDGKQLKINILSHPELTVSVISLFPAPLALDRQIPGLKRVEVQIPAYILAEGGSSFRVELVGI
ncbi:MAG: hypothetical protein HC892_21670 [Saprospiraceae bacterium]|nr:hypothetical protein [Saprospiraceae bacterium]